MKQILKKGETSVITFVFIQDSSSTVGAGLTGLAYNSGSLVGSYIRPGGTRQAFALATQTVGGAFSAGGFVEVDATNMPGVYRLDIIDAVLAAGVDNVIVMLKGATNMAPLLLEIQLVDLDLNTASVPQGADNNTILSSINIANGAVEADLTYIHGSGLTETAGQLAAAFKKFFDVAAPTATALSLPDAVPGATGGAFIAGTNAATTITTALTAQITGDLSGSVGGNVDGSVIGAVGTVTGSVGSVAGNVDGDVSGLVAGTVAGVTPEAAGVCATQAEVATEAAAALVAINLDHLMSVPTSNRATLPEVVDDTILANIMTKTDGDTSDFDQSSHSLEAIRDRGDAAWAGSPSAAEGTIADVSSGVYDLTATSGTLSTVDDTYNNMIITFYDNSGDVYETKRITDYDGTGLTRVTVDADLSFPPEDGVDTFVIWRPAYAPVGEASVSEADKDAIADKVWDEAEVDHKTVGTMGLKQHHSGKGR